HSTLAVWVEPAEFLLGIDADGGWIVSKALCPACRRFIVFLVGGYPQRHPDEGGFIGLREVYRELLVYPRAISRGPMPKEVPPSFATDYKEACLVLTDSPKAS